MTGELFAAKARHVTRRFGTFDIRVTRADMVLDVPRDVVVLTRGDVCGGEGVLCRVASACVTSTALDSAECECDLQIEAAMARIHEAGRGVLIYLTHDEGRGHGLSVKVRALANKNRGMDTFEAVEALGPKPDVRSYAAVRPILDALGVKSILLLTGSPDKRATVLDCGVKIEDVEPLPVTPHSHAMRSMQAKRARGHETMGTYADHPSLPYP